MVSIVPGDIVRIAKGERVPADIRILKVNNHTLYTNNNYQYTLK